jgi:anti-sigma factor RsiW
MNKPHSEICGPEWLDRLDRWLEGDLDVDEASEFESHLAICPRCQEEARWAEDLRTRLAALPRPAAPLDLADKVWTRVSSIEETEKQARLQPGAVVSLKRLAPSRPRNPAIWGWTLAMAASLVLILSVWSPEREKRGPQYTQAEIHQAERQVEATLAYVGLVTARSVQMAGRDAVEKGWAASTRATAESLKEIDMLSFIHSEKEGLK